MISIIIPLYISGELIHIYNSADYKENMNTQLINPYNIMNVLVSFFCFF